MTRCFLRIRMGSSIAIRISIWTAIVLTASITLNAQSLDGADRDSLPVPETWLTGKQLTQQMQQKTSATLTKVSLRSWLSRFSQSQRISIVLDRRVDANTLVSLDVREMAVERLLLKIARESNIEVCQIGDVVYLGPQAAVLRLLVAQQRSESRSKRGARHKSALFWLNLTTPSEAISQLVRDADVELQGVNKMPHDLLFQCSTPELPLDLALQLLLVQFDRTLTTEGGTASIALLSTLPEEQDPIGRLTISALSNASQATRNLKKAFPQLTIRRSRGNFILEGPPAELILARDHVVDQEQPSDSRANDRSSQVFTLRVQARRDQIMESIAKQLNLKVQWPTDARRLQSEVIQVEVENANLQTLLDQISGSTAYRIRESEGELLFEQK